MSLICPSKPDFDPIIFTRDSTAPFEVGSGRPGKKVVKTIEIEDEDGDHDEAEEAVEEEPMSMDDPLKPEPEAEPQPEKVQEQPEVLPQPTQPAPVEEVTQNSPTPPKEAPRVAPVKPTVDVKRASGRPAQPIRPGKKQVLVHEDEESEGSGSEEEAVAPVNLVPARPPQPPVQEAPRPPVRIPINKDKPQIVPPKQEPTRVPLVEPEAEDRPVILPPQDSSPLPPKIVAAVQRRTNPQSKAGRFSLEVRDASQSEDSDNSDQDSIISSNEERVAKPQLTVPVKEAYTNSKAPASTSKRRGQSYYAVDLNQSETEEEPDLVSKHLIATPRPTDPEALIAEKRWKSKEKHMFCAIGCCSFVFCVSIFLWIFLFQRLMVRNHDLSQVILYPPTLQSYHKEYLDFWLAYEKSHDVLHGKEDILAGDGESTEAFKAMLTQFTTSKDSIANGMDYIKLFLDKKNENRRIGRRLSVTASAPGDDHPRRLARNAQPTPAEAVDYLIEDIDLLNEAETAIRRDKSHHISSYGKTMEKVSSLYQEAYKIAFNYGNFYKQTLRIWVTSDNIFGLFQDRFDQLAKQIEEDHFRNKTLTLNNVVVRGTKTPVYRPVEGGILSFAREEPVNPNDRTPIKPRESYLVCQISGNVEDPDRQQLDTEFQFELAPAGETIVNRAGEIWNTIYEKENHFVKPQILRLAPDQSEVVLYARASPGFIESEGVRVRGDAPIDIVVSEVVVNCIQMSSYSKFPQYEK